MIEFLARADDGQSFTLAISGARRSYPNNKEGRRQAILDGLAALEPITAGQDVYLSSDAALQIVASVLYPDGIQTEVAYQVVYGVTEKAFIHIGYGEEVKLGPPHVPFPARGQYRKRLPAADPDAIR
ncbi:MAG: hypothetical protein ACRDHL_02260, partial [Candidatus Promineifilaceae bacterium]